MKEEIHRMIEEMERLARMGEIEKARLYLRKIENYLVLLLIKARGDDKKRGWEI